MKTAHDVFDCLGVRCGRENHAGAPELLKLRNFILGGGIDEFVCAEASAGLSSAGTLATASRHDARHLVPRCPRKLKAWKLTKLHKSVAMADATRLNLDSDLSAPRTPI